MKKERSSATASFSQRIRYSMVFKLNFKLLGMLLITFLLLNIIFTIMFLVFVLVKAEEGAELLFYDFFLTADLSSVEGEAAHNKYHLVATSKQTGLNLPFFIVSKLPLEDTVRRNIVLLPQQESLALFNFINDLTYQLQFDTRDQTFSINYALATDLQYYLLAMTVILIWQLLYLINRITKNNQLIKQALKPLEDLTSKARDLQQGLAQKTIASQGQNLKSLAGEISSIDVSKLDRRLELNDAQKELKDLALAINNMLARINQAYQSQIRFVADASHELRTPIAVIQGYANLLDRWGKKDPKTLQESIAAIKSETESMKNLIEQLLFLARGDNDIFVLEHTVFEGSKIIEEIINEAQLINLENEFEISLAPEALLKGDRNLIKQALRILVDNSIKYSPAQGKIKIAVYVKDRKVIFRVQDEGIGINAQDLPYIFERFYRSDESRTRKTGGSGLGLAIAKWIIEKHKGHFEVLSRVDIGTRIEVILDAYPQANK